MLARSNLPEEFRRWNAQWGAPYGKPWARRLPVSIRWRRPLRPFVGYFAFQHNNTNRAFEYPWSYHAAPLSPGMRVLEIGGSLAGFQFVLDKAGASVVNLDPGEEARGKGWEVTRTAHGALNRAFGTNVELKPCFIEEAGLADASFDRAYAISVLEHIPDADLASLMRHLSRVLKPGGVLIATIDLFLDTRPFADAERNRYGKNVDVRWLVEGHGFRLVSGERSELFGYPEFDADKIRRRAEAGELLRGSYPCLVQCVVCGKV